MWGTAAVTERDRPNSAVMLKYWPRNDHEDFKEKMKRKRERPFLNFPLRSGLLH